MKHEHIGQWCEKDKQTEGKHCAWPCYLLGYGGDTVRGKGWEAAAALSSLHLTLNDTDHVCRRDTDKEKNKF